MLQLGDVRDQLPVVREEGSIDRDVPRHEQSGQIIKAIDLGGKELNVSQSPHQVQELVPVRDSQEAEPKAGYHSNHAHGQTLA